jgi:hypothetical protein
MPFLIRIFTQKALKTPRFQGFLTFYTEGVKKNLVVSKIISIFVEISNTLIY